MLSFGGASGLKTINTLVPHDLTSGKATVTAFAPTGAPPAARCSLPASSPRACARRDDNGSPVEAWLCFYELPAGRVRPTDPWRRCEFH